MSANIAPMGDRFVAKSVELASITFCMAPFLGRFIVGKNPVEWHATTTHADQVQSWWYTAGNPESGKLPVNFRTATILGTECGALYDQAKKYDGVPAAAFKIGEAVLATELPPEEELPVHPDGNGSGLVVVSLREGRGPLGATLGIYLPNTNHFVDATEDVVCIDRKVPVEVMHLFYSDAVQL